MYIQAFILGGSNERAYISSLEADDEAPSPTAAPLTNLSGEVDTANVDGTFGNQRIYTDTSSQVGIRAGAASTTVRIVTMGWNDNRGRND